MTASLVLPHLVKFLIDNDIMILQKFNNACLVTGEISEDNIAFGDGKINLSKDGAESLIEEIRLYATV
ncbi:hypothetical protein [Virgibacillus sp. Bac332]|uniref:hypothetical protein n=1 Tax=Virgibacillus sp. Bac332 TaxID=2419842 RepID=UPI0013CF1828|nr:hypothetical protein [Virgibacillus sp. Bac332]